MTFSGSGKFPLVLNDTTGNALSGQYDLLNYTGTLTTSEITLAGNAAGEGSLSILGGDELVFTASSVPEPGTWALMLGGLGFLAIYRRKFLKLS